MALNLALLFFFCFVFPYENYKCTKIICKEKTTIIFLESMTTLKSQVLKSEKVFDRLKLKVLFSLLEKFNRNMLTQFFLNVHCVNHINFSISSHWNEKFHLCTTYSTRKETSRQVHIVSENQQTSSRSWFGPIRI